jgi:hypothetical protein
LTLHASLCVTLHVRWRQGDHVALAVEESNHSLQLPPVFALRRGSLGTEGRRSLVFVKERCEGESTGGVYVAPSLQCRQKREGIGFRSVCVAMTHTSLGSDTSTPDPNLAIKRTTRGALKQHDPAPALTQGRSP